MDYKIITAPSYQCDGKRVPCIEVFDRNTGEVISFCRRLPFEGKAAWVSRALANAAA